jgi:hypothetical protein
MSAIDRVVRLLSECGSDAAHFPATTLYNEGWMLRLVLDWCSAHPFAIEPFVFLPGSRWYSEALLPSRFGGRRSPAEGFTHADAVIGHFQFRPGGRGDIALAPGARQLSVVEAKMGSLLSTGTSHAPSYNQAARNVACIANAVASAADASASLEHISFTVIAPRQRIQEGVFSAHLTHSAMNQAVRARAAMFGAAHDEWLAKHFEPFLPRCKVEAVSWEDTIEAIGRVDSEAGRELAGFLELCLKYNPLRSPRARSPGGQVPDSPNVDGADNSGP